MNIELRNGLSVKLIDEGQLADYFREKGKYEPETLVAWTSAIRRGSEVIDIGAHTGLFSILAAKCGARPIAIEPLPFLVSRIRRNAELNKVNFTIVEAAASDFNGRAELGYRRDVSLPYGASILRRDKPDHAKLMVKTIRIDDMKVSNVSAIKIDVERYEPTVLKGALRTIDRWKPKLIIEALNDRAKNKNLWLLRYTHRLEKMIDRRNMLMVPR